MTKIKFNKAKIICELVAGKDVLDIGCVDHNLDVRNKGKWLHGMIKDAAKSVVGMDYEAEQIEKLKSEGYDVVFGDATNFDIGRKFDVIIAGDIVEHLINHEGFFNSVKKHLRENGIVVITTPNANCILYFIENVLIGHELDNTDHVCIFTPVTMKKLLEKCGFELDYFIFMALNCTHYQTKVVRKIVAYFMFITQVVFGLIRPSLCRHFLTVAKVNKLSR